MLRHALPSTVWTRRLVSSQYNNNINHHLSIRRGLAAAATSAEKRALNPTQLKGGDGTSNGSSPPPPTPPQPAKGGGGDSSLPFILGGIALVGVGGVAYSQGLIPGFKKADPVDVAVQETSKKEQTTANRVGKVKKEPAPSDAVKENASVPSAGTGSEPGGNRVVTISLPQGTQRSSSSSSVEATKHPVGGNRVEMAPKLAQQKEDGAGTPEPSVDTALQELRDQLSQESSITLKEARQELAKLSSLDTKELDTMTPTQLKIRLIQLSKDLEERTKWEAVRLKEFLAMKEQEVQNKYLILMKKQRMEAESTLDHKLKEQAYELTSQAEKAMEEKEKALQGIIDHSLKIQEQQHQDEKESFEKKTEEAISAKYEELFGKSMAELKQSFSQKMEQRVAQIQALSKKMSALEFSLQNTKTYQTGSVQAHRMSAAALSLIDMLESSKPAGAAIQALQAAAYDNVVIASAVQALPEAAAVSGIATLQELQTKFEEHVHPKCRQAALVPVGQKGLEGQLLGMVFSTLKFPPGPGDAAPESEKDAAEFVLARARRHVQLGELEQAVGQMQKLQGQASFVAKDWTQKAKERVAVDKALKVIKIECALANESMGQVPKE